MEKRWSLSATLSNRARLSAALGFLILTLASCGKTPGEGAPQPQKPPEAAPELRATRESIQVDFVDRRCLSCHQAPTEQNRHVALADIRKVIEGAPHEPGGHLRTLIKPGCPKQSFFHSILRERKMPPSPAQAVDEKELSVIAEWITSLKPDAKCDDGEPPDDPDDF